MGVAAVAVSAGLLLVAAGDGLEDCPGARGLDGGMLAQIVQVPLNTKTMVFPGSYYPALPKVFINQGGCLTSCRDSNYGLG